ncbi:hypothetical protein WJX84_010501 [Apatococcus fuscideae]|uniref:Uncharacterized protein n=1 Tax=Apatococcus fuscideae TaxID=2026836 RepID=A0AAW1SSK5_9CHLO
MPKDIVSVPLPRKPRPVNTIVHGTRLDGRGPEEFRPIFFSTGVIPQATGSAYAELHNTKLMVGIYGPRPSDRWVGFSEEGRLDCDVKMAPFSSWQRTKWGQSPDERAMAGLLGVALEAGVQRSAFPKATVDVQCLILEAGGSELAVAIAAASLALADAGIPMRDLITSCTVSRVDNQLLLDATSDEAFQEDGGVLLAMLPSLGQVTQLLVKGEWAGSELEEAVQLSMSGCKDVDEICRQVLQEAVQPA